VLARKVNSASSGFALIASIVSSSAGTSIPLRTVTDAIVGLLR
jgi:hypothetical protein